MARPALRQSDRFAEVPYESDIWLERLLAAFADANLRSGFLPLAEKAIEACPGDAVILILAATAALLDERPERALVFLKRFSKHASAPEELAILVELDDAVIALPAMAIADIEVAVRRNHDAAGPIEHVRRVAGHKRKTRPGLFPKVRGYKVDTGCVGFTVAHQYLHQLEPAIRHAVLGNARTIISFRVGAEDAPYLEQEFQYRFERTDVTQLGTFQVYLKLMIDGVPSKPFSALTLPPKP